MKQMFRWPIVMLAAVIFVTACALVSSFGFLTVGKVVAQTTGEWVPTGSLTDGRRLHTATLLDDGRVLVAGGMDQTGSDVPGLSIAEIYDSEDGIWNTTGSLNEGRYGHTATKLPDGRVLVTGGRAGYHIFLNSVEIYDPISQTWTLTATLSVSRTGHSATLLKDGRVLVVGGTSDTVTPIVHTSAEIYDPATGSWSPTGSLDSPRGGHSATLLDDGRVLVVGGYDTTWMGSAEIYDPDSETWSTVEDPPVCHGNAHPAVRLLDGRVLVVGGACESGPPGIVAEVSLFDPDTMTWSAATPLPAPREAHTATLLPNGRVLVAGGDNGAPPQYDSALIYDPGGDSWTPTAPMTIHRSRHTATLLDDGRVLAVAGWGDDDFLASAELYQEVGGCPANSVCVVDEHTAPVAGALVYHNGTPVTANGSPRLTDEGGVLTFTDLDSGDYLVALQPVYTQTTHRAAHDPDGRGNVTFRVYRTSMPVGNDGQVYPYIVPSGNVSHTLTIQPENTLVLFNIVASIQWDASSDYIHDLEIGLEKASDMLYDATDGQMAFGRVTIYDNGNHWADADIQIRAHNHTWPHAYIGGINTIGAKRLIYKGIDPEPGQIVLGRKWSGSSSAAGEWQEKPGYTTIAHEFGHYALFLFDEYFYYPENDNYRLRLPSRCSFYPSDPASLMYYQYSRTEFCNRPEHYPEYHGGPPTRQTQVYGSGETSWLTIQGVFSDVLQSISESGPPWTIISPPDRGVDYVLGPELVLDLPMVAVENDDDEAWSKKPIVVEYEGRPVWGALVSLHKTNGVIIDQGLTNDQGEIDVFGAGAGDTIQIRTISNNLGGRLTVQNALPETANLSPVFGGQSGQLSSQDVSTDTMPLIAIVPGADGSTIHYFMEKTGELSGSVSAKIEGDQAPPVAEKTMSYDGNEDYYFVQFTDFTTGTLSGLTFEIGATFGAGFVEIGIGHDRSHTDGDEDELDLTTTDGNLVLNAPGGSFAGPTYVVANPTNALPGPPPADRVVVGEPYSIQPSGSITGSQKAMALTLHYQTGSLGDVVTTTLQPFYWRRPAIGDGWWDPVVSYTVGITNVSASTNLFGTYVLMGQTLPVINSVILTGSVILIEGSNFENGASVRLGSAITLATVYFFHENSLMAVLPPNLPTGSYDVTVINPNGQEGTCSQCLLIGGADHKTYLPLIMK